MQRRLSIIAKLLLCVLGVTLLIGTEQICHKSHRRHLAEDGSPDAVCGVQGRLCECV